MSAISVDPATYSDETTYWVYTNNDGFSYVILAVRHLNPSSIALYTEHIASAQNVDTIYVDGYGIGGAVADVLAEHLYQTGWDGRLVIAHGPRIRVAL